MSIRTQRRVTAIFSYTVLIIWSLILFFPMYVSVSEIVLSRQVA